MQTENLWGALKRAKHQNDSSILFQVRDGLNSTSIEIKVGDSAWTEYAKCVQSLRREIHVTSGIEWRSRDKEHVLGLDETSGVIVNYGADFIHGLWIA